MKRFMLNIATWSTLLLFSGIMLLWVKSYFSTDNVNIARNNLDAPGDHGALSKIFELVSSRGIISLGIDDRDDRTAYEVDENGDYRFPRSARPPNLEFDYYSVEPYSVDIMPSPVQSGSAYHCYGPFGTAEEMYSGAHAMGVQYHVTTPHWFAAGLFSLLPIIRLTAKYRAAKRLRAGFCPVCGYDLRATPERCPECGTSSTPSG